MLIALVIALNPIGVDVIRLAFFAGEALSRNIWRPIVLTGIAIMAFIAALEWQLRRFILKRRARLAKPLN